MFNSNILLKSFPSGLGIVLVIFLFFLPIIFVVSIYVKSKLNKSKFIHEFIELAAYVMTAGSEASSKEIRYVHFFLEKQFGKKDLISYKKVLADFLKKQTSIHETLVSVDQNQDLKTKNKLIHFLVKIAIIDGYLKQSELIALEQVCKGIGLVPAKLIVILGKYSYITENEHNRQRQRQKSSVSNASSGLKRAFKALELDMSASEKSIKKAYRKLVLLYHPDKISHQSVREQKNAKEMFQKVNDAYDLIKSHKGFK